MKVGVYFTLGDLGLETSVAILEGAAKGGADLLEIGLPFSDPLLDGPSIQASHFRALAAGGIRWGDLCDAIEHLKKSCPGTLISVMTSSQLLYDRERLQRLPAVDGLLVTDISCRSKSPVALPSPRVWFLAQDVVLSNTLMPPEQISMVYLARVQGLTGAGQAAAGNTGSAIERIKGCTAAPIWLGFGISNAADVRECETLGADGAILGSAFVESLYTASKSLPNIGQDRDVKLAAHSERWVRALKEN